MGLMSTIHSRRVHPAFHCDNKGLQCLSVEVANRDPMDLLRDVFRHVAPSVAAPLRDEVVRWLLSCNGVLRRVALDWVLGVEDGSVLGINIVHGHVSYHIVHDTDHAGQPWVVSLALVLQVSLEILKNNVSRAGLKVNQRLNRHDSAVFLHRNILVDNPHALEILNHGLAGVLVLAVPHGRAIVHKLDLRGVLAQLFVICESGNVGSPSRRGRIGNSLFRLRE